MYIKTVAFTRGPAGSRKIKAVFAKNRCFGERGLARILPVAEGKYELNLSQLFTAINRQLSLLSAGISALDRLLLLTIMSKARTVMYFLLPLTAGRAVESPEARKVGICLIPGKQRTQNCSIEDTNLTI